MKLGHTLTDTKLIGVERRQDHTARRKCLNALWIAVRPCKPERRSPQGWVVIKDRPPPLLMNP